MYNTFLNIINNESFLGHISNNRKETLQNHTALTEYYYKKIIEDKGLENIIDNLCSKFEHKELIRDMFNNAIIFHDLGKINPTFQYHKLTNRLPDYIDDSKYTSNHSLLSAYIYISAYYDYIDELYPRVKDRVINRDNKQIRMYLKSIVCSFGYLISKHHSHLNDELFETDKNSLSFIDKLNELDQFIQQDKYYISSINKDMHLNIIQIKKMNKSNIEFMVLCKMLYSLLISADYMATYDFINSSKVSDLGLFNKYIKQSFRDIFENDKIVLGTREQKYNIPINELRGQIFLETEEVLLKNKDKNLYFLEAPTGAGKTYSSLNLLLHLLSNYDINKAYYIFPFNNLSDQTYNTVSNIFEDYSDYICKINSITSIKETTNDFQTDYLNKLFLNYPLSILSHVGLFNMIFGCSKNSSFNFYNLANSVIILDEIQSYNITIWKETINIFSTYAKLLNIKIVIMSATLPKLDILLEEDMDIVDLLPNKEKYYNNPLFKNRVKLRFDLMRKKQDLNSLYKELKKELPRHNKFLIEFQDKTNCRLFYNLLKNKDIDEFEIYELTGDDNPIYRNHVINRTKIEGIKIIIVGTQVIEAGIDIDMDYGFKEKSVIESEEQFLGRINRSATKKNCYAAFFRLQDTKVSFLYKDDLRFKYSLDDSIFEQILINKDFYSYFKNLLTEMNRTRALMNSENYKSFITEIDNLLFDTIENRMKLITTDTISIYIPHTKIDTLNGYDVWQQYVSIVSNKQLNFAEKKILISRITRDMSVFTFNIFNNDKLNLEQDFIETLNGMYYIKDGDRFMTDEGKLNRELLLQELT